MSEKHTNPENEKLRKENEELRRDNVELKKELDKIKKEFEKYKMRHPESVVVKNGKPYIVKSSTKSQTQKRAGAIKGHKPYFRPMPEQVDEVCRVPVKECPECKGSNLSENVQEVRTRTVEDIPVCEPVVTRYEIERRYCKDCKKLVETPVSQALPRARLGLRAMLVVVYLKIGLRLPVESVQKLVETIFDLRVSEGEVCLILEQMAEAFGPYYDQLTQEIRNAPARHMDETSWRINGINVWLWAFITKGEALYKIAASRSHEVPLEVLGN